jgi:amino-acid N-acetyltransferase
MSTQLDDEPRFNESTPLEEPTGAATLRRAIANDQATIKRMVYAARLDRSSLHWSHFIVAELPQIGIVGIGQIRPYRNCPELGSLLVLKSYRNLGIASQIVYALLASRPAPIYLECASYNLPYYLRFGFYEIPWHQAPWPLSLKAGVGTLAGRLGLLRGYTVAAMRWDGDQDSIAQRQIAVH